jgi:hypothetical protein
MDDEMLITYYEKSSKELLEIIKSYNNITSLVFSGEYNKDVQGRSFGFFTKILSEEDTELKYPLLNTKIERIFIATNELENKSRYSFLVDASNKSERVKQQNPFVLSAKVKSIKEVFELTETMLEVKAKREVLLGLEKKIINSEGEYELRANQIEERLLKLSDEREKEFVRLIDEHNKAIVEKIEEINHKETSIINLNTTISKIESEILESTKKKDEMEVTLNYLRSKIDLCKNLDFLSIEDSDKYVQILSPEFFDMGENYLDFEEDLASDFPQLVTHIQNFLYHKKGLIYTVFQIRNFLSLLMTNDLIILSGLSGSGKTQIVKSFAEALGGVAKIIPVKPNWTSSDDLLGYFNPIQSSFLPTPFTEAIAEAIQNPNQIYLICLDEMNLARVEYYFADFLSKMEERSQQPEIELYAKHEEELFVSEFKTFISLLESATGENVVSSWQEFLETDSIRNRFFELLGNAEQDNVLQLHSKMKRRLLDILKFPSTLKIPNNVRFIGAINVDETTHYFSPKILDRVHIVKFENPLLIEDEVNSKMQNSGYELVLKPVYLKPKYLGERVEMPSLSSDESLAGKLKQLNKEFLLPLSIDFGVRSMRQSLNYALIFRKIFPDFPWSEYSTLEDLEKNIEVYNSGVEAIVINTIINQKILPRFLFDGSGTLKNGLEKMELLKKLITYINETINPIFDSNLEVYDVGYFSDEYLRDMIRNAESNGNQVNFFA